MKNSASFVVQGVRIAGNIPPDKWAKMVAEAKREAKPARAGLTIPRQRKHDARNLQASKCSLVIPRMRKHIEREFELFTLQMFGWEPPGVNATATATLAELEAVSRAFNAYVARRRRAEAKARVS